MSNLHLICGLPGAGKSTLARSLELEFPSVRMTPDEWLLKLGYDGNEAEARRAIEALQWEMAERLLRLGLDVILEWGFWSRAERDGLRARAAAIGAKTTVHFCDVPREELVRRLEQRAKTDPHSIVVYTADLDRWIAEFEAPSLDEMEFSKSSPDWMT